MSTLDDIEVYLPKYLSEKNLRVLREELHQFPENIDDRLYSSIVDNEETILQGDCLKGLPILTLPDTDNIKWKNGLVVSNTCDISLNNSRIPDKNLLYAPIMSIQNFRSMLVDNGLEEQQADEKVKTIKSQEITNLFYLPSNELIDESIAFLDRILHVRKTHISRKALGDIRLFSLSDYGFYLFLFKISVHFTRIQENLNRGV